MSEQEQVSVSGGDGSLCRILLSVVRDRNTRWIIYFPNYGHATRVTVTIISRGDIIKGKEAKHAGGVQELERIPVSEGDGGTVVFRVKHEKSQRA